MNFEEVYRKFLEGTASDEETLFLAAEIRKAKEVDALLSRLTENPIFEEASDETVTKARKTFLRKSLYHTFITILVSLTAFAAVVCGVLFIPSTISAKQQENYSREECAEIALERAREYDPQSVREFVIHDIDKHIYLGDGLGEALYTYEIELRNGEYEIEIWVNASSGFTEITDVASSGHV